MNLVCSPFCTGTLLASTRQRTAALEAGPFTTTRHDVNADDIELNLLSSSQADSWPAEESAAANEALLQRQDKLRKHFDDVEMKFSHSIQFNAVPDWSSHYIAYSNLKKL